MKNDFFLVISLGLSESKSNIYDLVKDSYNFENIGQDVYVASSVTQSHVDSVIVFGDIYGSSDKRNSFDESLGLLGCYSILKVGNSNSERPISFAVDYFGFGIIYAYEEKGIVIASNNLHEILSIINSIGLGEVNVDYLRLLDYLSLPLIQQPIFDELPIKGLFRLPADSVYSIQAGVLVKENTGIALSIKHQEKDYFKLISMAVDEITGNLDSLLQVIDDGKTLEVDMSGGKDSRMLLAACTKIPGALEKLRLNTRDDPGTRDLEIICLIADKYDLKFNSYCSDVLYRIDKNLCLDLWLKYYYTEYVRLSLPNISSRGESYVVSLSGGGGEAVTKSANVEWVRKQSDSSKSNSDVFLNSIMRFSGCSEEISKNDKLQSSIRKQVDIIGGEDLDDFLNKFYLRYRNRVHFGMNAITIYHGKKLLFPLQSKYLYQAASMLSYSERASGKVIYDFINMCCPDLLDFPFASKFEYYEKNHKRKELKNGSFDLSEKLKEWTEAGELLRKSREESVRKYNSTEITNQSNSDFTEYLFHETLKAIDALSSITNERFFSAEPLCLKILSEYNRSLSRGYHISYYILALWKLLSPVVKLDQHQTKYFDMYKNSVLINPISKVLVGSENGKVTVLVETDKFFTDAQYAYYLIKGKDIVLKNWYSKDAVKVFDVGFSDITELKVFLRLKNQKFTKSVDLK